MKRRLLKWVGSRKGEDGRERIVFRNAATDEEIEIEEIDLADQAMVAVVHEIERALAGNGPSDRSNSADRFGGEANS
jgi:hypothetical protein